MCMLLLSNCKFQTIEEIDEADLIAGLVLNLVYPYLIETCALTPSRPTGPIAPITSGYGALGVHSVAVKKLANPSFARDVCVYHSTAGTAAPVLFLFHGFSAPSAEPYMSLIEFAVSKGYTVVYPLYFSDGRAVTENYTVMSTGLEAAIASFPELMDLTKVGYLGHSYGGGAVPFLAHDGVVNRGRGTTGNFLFQLAPWYTFDMPNAKLTTFPGNTKFITQVYENDEVTDHRMAEDIFNNINVATAEKDFQLLYTETDPTSGYRFEASHYTPNKVTLTVSSALDGHDFYGVFRQLDALADYSWNGTAAGKTTALGDGGTTQTFMGQYANGAEARRMYAGDTPLILKPSSFYSSPFSDPRNPRP